MNACYVYCEIRVAEPLLICKIRAALQLCTTLAMAKRANQRRTPAFSSYCKLVPTLLSQQIKE